MLGVTRYKPQAYPPPGFPRFSGASADTPAFKRLQDKANPMLQGMLDRKKGSNDILQQRAAAFPSASTPAVSAPMQAHPALSITSSHNIYTDAESGSDPTETEGETQALPTPPRRDLMRITATGMSLASGALASGQQVVSAAAQSGINYATAKSQQALSAGVNYGVRMARSSASLAPPLYHGAVGAGGRVMRGAQGYGGSIMNAAIEHGVPAARMIGGGLGHTTLAIGGGVGSATLAIGSGVGGATLAVGSGVGSVLSSLTDAAVEHGPPVGRMVLNGVGHGLNVAAEHGPPLAKAAIGGLAYQGSKAFQALYNAIKRLPPLPALEMSEYQGGDSLASSYQPIRNLKRSNSPGRSSASASASASASVPTSAPSHRAHEGPDTVTFNTVDEREKYSTGRALLGEQLKLRPNFRTVTPGKQATAKWIRSLTPRDMIQLLLTLDGKG